MFVCFVCDSLCDVVCGVCLCVWFYVPRCSMCLRVVVSVLYVVVVCVNVIVYVLCDVLCGVVWFGFC